MASKLHEFQQQISTQMADITGFLMDLMKQIPMTEVESSLLHSLALNLLKGDYSTTST